MGLSNETPQVLDSPETEESQALPLKPAFLVQGFTASHQRSGAVWVQIFKV